LQRRFAGFRLKLRLQSRVAELEARLSKYEALERPLRKLKCVQDWGNERDEAENHLIEWVEKNVKACGRWAFDTYSIHAICDPYALREAISRCVYKIVSSKKFSDQLASQALDIVAAAPDAASYVDVKHVNPFGPEPGDSWLNNKIIITDIIMSHIR
jgi:hypothetical protein